MKAIHLDVETFSEEDLGGVGSYAYFRHPSTELLCACYEIGDEENGRFTSHYKGTWRKGEKTPKELTTALREGVTLWAHNAEFEREAINQLTDWGHIEVSQLRCTLALAACQSLPLSLDRLGKCIDIDRKKDADGKRLMMKVCKLNKAGERHEMNESEWATLVDYCTRDVEAEIDIGNKLLPFSPMQLRAYHDTVRINERGIPVNRNLIKSCIKARENLAKVANEIVTRVSGHSLDMLMSPLQLLMWLSAKGYDVKNTQKATLEGLLATDISDEVRTVLEQRLIVSSASLKKYDVMQYASVTDGRIRGCLQFHAAFTGRWGGRLVQPQNLPRPSIKDIGAVESKVLQSDRGDIEELKSLVRHSIQAPEGKEFICADWANIEGRMLAYLAGEEWKLEAFSEFDVGKGHDLYKLAYAKSFRVDVEEVDSDQRAIGKVQELALGYGGGAGAIEAFAPDKFTMAKKEEMKKSYRKANKKIVQFWHDLESTALKVVKCKSKGEIGKIRMRFSNGSLYIMLPSGRCLRYPNAQVRTGETPWGAETDVLSYMKYDKGQWLRTETFGGKLAENVVQGSCACLMMEALTRFDGIVMSVHDEIVCEIDEGTGDLAEFEKTFSIVPDWCEGLPVSSEGWIGKEYRK